MLSRYQPGTFLLTAFRCFSRVFMSDLSSEFSIISYHGDAESAVCRLTSAPSGDSEREELDVSELGQTGSDE